MIEAAPARCREKIAVSTEDDLCPKLDNGGYTVHLVPTLPSIIDLNNNIKIAGNINQYDKLFIRGKAISGTLQYRGTNILPNPEIRLGIKKKKIITKA